MTVDPKLTKYVEAALKSEERLHVWVLVPGGVLTGTPIWEQDFWSQFGGMVDEDDLVANNSPETEYLHLDRVELVSAPFEPADSLGIVRRPHLPIVRIRLDSIAAWGLVDAPREDAH